MDEMDSRPDVKRSQRKERVLLVAHVMSGILLITKGLHELSGVDPSPAIVALTFGGGVLSVVAAIFHRRLHGRHGVGALISLIESAACLFVAMSYIQDGTRYLQYPLFVASAIALGAMVAQLRRRRAGA